MVAALWKRWLEWKVSVVINVTAVKGWGRLVGADAKQAGEALCEQWDKREGAQLNWDAVQTCSECTVKHLLRLRSESGPQNFLCFFNYFFLLGEINGSFYQTDKKKRTILLFKHVHHKF